MKIRPVIIILLVLIALLAMIGGSTPLWYLLIFAVIVISIGYLWAFINVRGIDVEVKNPPEQSRAGEWAEEEIVVSNNSRLPKFGVSIQEITTVPDSPETLILNMSPKASHTWKPKIYCRRRGMYYLGKYNISAADPLGLITHRRTSGTYRQLLVYPEILGLPFFQPELYIGPGRGSGRWLRSGTSSSISRVREYASGDTLNHVHWPSTAHTGTLMVKVFEPDPMRHYSRNIWIVLDMHREVQAGYGDESTAECGITIAASIFNKYMDTGKETGFIVAGDKSYVYSPDVGDDYRARVEKALALLKADGKVPVDTLISQETARFEPDSVVIIITPAVDELVTASVRNLQNSGCTVAAILLDPSSFDAAAGRVGNIKDLLSGGSQVYVVRKGQDIARALDSRKMTSPLVYGE